MNNPVSKFAMGKGEIPHILKPVANMINPPTAEKSAIITSSVKGRINYAPKYSPDWIKNCGRAALAKVKPNVVAKIPAVKKSRKAFMRRKK